jgi:hypothetical protein
MEGQADAVDGGRVSQGNTGPADDAAAQRPLPCGGAGVEMTSSSHGSPTCGGAVRRRARVLERLESMNLEQHGIIDKQELVGVADASQHAKALADDNT